MRGNMLADLENKKENQPKKKQKQQKKNVYEYKTGHFTVPWQRLRLRHVVLELV